MNLILTRFSYSPTETEGTLWISESEPELATIERPWIPADNPGGLAFRSCIPEGTYFLEHWTRPNGSRVLILWNEELDVYKNSAERADRPGRDYILFHAGNWVGDVQGCIAPGMARAFLHNSKSGKIEPAVRSSAQAVGVLLRGVPEGEVHRLVIQSSHGTKEKDNE